MNDWRPRIAIDLSPDEFEKLNKYIPRGLKKRVIGTLIEGLVKALEKDPVNTVTDILTMELTALQLMGLEKEDGNT